jgi:hypothetical protein
MASGGEPSNPSSRADIRWKFYQLAQENSTNGCICNLCGKTIWGGITRLKEHLMAKTGNCKPCLKCPKEVREELNQHAKNKKKQEKEAYERVKLDMIDEGDSDEEASLDEGSRELASKGPIDLFFRKPETAIQCKKKEKLRQSSIKAACDKELTAQVHQYIARFWYQAGLSFNMVKLESFQDMLTAIEAFGKHLKAPSCHEIRVPLLNKELAHTEELLKAQ